VTRGSLVESRHRGAIAVARADGELLLALGDVTRPVYPRSAVKLLQAVPLIESGAADAFGLDDAELAVACASHSGDRVHVEAVRSLFGSAGLDESALACGAHWPVSEEAFRDLVRGGARALPIHNNCAGKHAGMLATCVHLGLDPRGYERVDHPVQIAIAGIISEACAIALNRDDAGVDGCSVPTWALPLGSLAQGFARFGSGVGLAATRAEAAERLAQACFQRPVLVAGEGRFDTIAMRALRARNSSSGNRGVHCAALPDLASASRQVDDGVGAERALAEILVSLIPDAGLRRREPGEVFNWRGLRVGQAVASAT
jgi:L-asparaginase II